ncbi:MAG: transglutaminase-like domain-containing protein [Anaerovoracaceae bacterium]
MTGRKSNKKVFALVLTMALIFTLLPTQLAYGAVKSSVKAPILVDSFETGDATGDDYVKINTSGSSINVDYKSILPAVKYRVTLRGVGKGTTVATQRDVNASGQFNTSLDVGYVPDGTYYLLIARAANSEQAVGWTYIGGSKGYCFIGVPIKITSGTAKIVKYQDVINNNEKLKKAAVKRKAPQKCMSKSLSDLSLVFRDPRTGKRSVGTSTTKMVKFFKKTSDEIVAGAPNDYEKMRKIYAYVSDNFYYDTIAFQEQRNQYTNPYRNLYNLINNKTSPNSRKTSNGKANVATTCVGYGAMVAALGRAQGIPCRVANGHALTTPWNTWGTEKGIKKMDHWWAEAYVDGRWFMVDSTRGTNAKWDSNTGEWNELVEGPLTYNYFDPSPQFLSNTHMYHTYY